MARALATLAWCWLVMCLSFHARAGDTAQDVDVSWQPMQLTRDNHHVRRLLQAVQAGASDVPPAERDTLVRLWNATNGPRWNITKPWGQGSACSWPGVSCCTAVSTQSSGSRPDVGYFLWASQETMPGSQQDVWHVQACKQIGSVAALVMPGFNLSGLLPDNLFNELPGLKVLDLSYNPGLAGGGRGLVQLVLSLPVSRLVNTQLSCSAHPLETLSKANLPVPQERHVQDTQELEQQGWARVALPSHCTPPVSLEPQAWFTIPTADKHIQCSDTLIGSPVMVGGQQVSSATVAADPRFWNYQGCICRELSRALGAADPIKTTNGPQRPVLYMSGNDLLLVCVEPTGGEQGRSRLQAGYIAAVSVGTMLVCILVFMFVIRRRLWRHHSGDNKSASWLVERGIPPGTRPDLYSNAVSLVATDVEGSTELWEWEPQTMNQALALHDKFMRASLAACGGYEVTTEGDAFLVAWHTPVAAVRWCLMLQQGLLKLAWPPRLLEHRLCRARPLIMVASPSKVSAPGQPVASDPHLLTLFQGLNVRMGVATGVPSSVKPHPTTGRMQYNGLVLRLATAVADMALGGQVLLEPCTFQALNGSLNRLHVEPHEIQVFVDHVNTTAEPSVKAHTSQWHDSNRLADASSTAHTFAALKDKASSESVFLNTGPPPVGVVGPSSLVSIATRGSSMYSLHKAYMPVANKPHPRRVTSRLDLSGTAATEYDEPGYGCSTFLEQRNTNGPQSLVRSGSHGLKHTSAGRQADGSLQTLMTTNDVATEYLLNGEQDLTTAEMGRMSSVMALFSKSVFMSQSGHTRGSGQSTLPPTPAPAALDAWPHPHDEACSSGGKAHMRSKADLPSLPEDDPENLCRATATPSSLRSEAVEDDEALLPPKPHRSLTRRAVSFQLRRKDDAEVEQPTACEFVGVGSRASLELGSTLRRCDDNGPAPTAASRATKPRSKTFYHVRHDPLSNLSDPSFTLPPMRSFPTQEKHPNEQAVIPVRLRSPRGPAATLSTELSGDRLRKAASKATSSISSKASVQSSWLLDQLNAARSQAASPALSPAASQASVAPTGPASLVLLKAPPETQGQPSNVSATAGVTPAADKGPRQSDPATPCPPSPTSSLAARVHSFREAADHRESKSHTANALSVISKIFGVSQPKAPAREPRDSNSTVDLLPSLAGGLASSVAGRPSSSQSIGSLLIADACAATEPQPGSSSSNGPKSASGKGRPQSWTFPVLNRPADSHPECAAGTVNTALFPIAEKDIRSADHADASSDRGPIAEGLEGWDDFSRATRATPEHIRCSANRLSRFAVEQAASVARQSQLTPTQEAASGLRSSAHHSSCPSVRRSVSSPLLDAHKARAKRAAASLATHCEEDSADHRNAAQSKGARHCERDPVRRSISSPLLDPAYQTHFNAPGNRNQDPNIPHRCAPNSPAIPDNTQFSDGPLSDGSMPVGPTFFRFKTTGKTRLQQEQVPSQSGARRSNADAARKLVLSLESQERRTPADMAPAPPPSLSLSKRPAVPSDKDASDALPLPPSVFRSDLPTLGEASLSPSQRLLSTASDCEFGAAVTNLASPPPDTAAALVKVHGQTRTPGASLNTLEHRLSGAQQSPTGLSALSRDVPVHPRVKRRSSWLMGNLTTKPSLVRDDSVVGDKDLWNQLAEQPKDELQHVVIIDMGVHLIKSLGPSLPQDLVQGLQVVQILPEALSARASYLNHVQSKRMIAPSFFDAPGANLALVPRSVGSPALQYPPVVMMFISPEHLGSVAESAEQSVYDQSLALFCQTVRSVLQEFQLYECQESQGVLMVVAAEPSFAVEAALLLQLRLLSADWPEALLDLPIAEEVRTQDTGCLLFRGLRAKIGIYVGVPITVTPHTTTGRADYFGVLVNRAARYMAGAVGGQILVDLEVCSMVTNSWRSKAARTGSIHSGAQLGVSHQRTSATDVSLSSKAATSHSHSTGAEPAILTLAAHFGTPQAGPSLLQAESVFDSAVAHTTPAAQFTHLISSHSKLLDSFGLLSDALTEPNNPEAGTAVLLLSYPANIIQDRSEYSVRCVDSANPSSSSLPIKVVSSRHASKGTSNGAASPSGCGLSRFEVEVLDLGEYEFKGLPVPQAVMGFQLVQLSDRTARLGSSGLGNGKARCIRPGLGLVDTCFVSL